MGRLTAHVLHTAHGSPSADIAPALYCVDTDLAHCRHR